LSAVAIPIYLHSWIYFLVVLHHRQFKFIRPRTLTEIHSEATARVLKVGDLTVAIDGTKLLANASKHSAMSHERIEQQMKLATDQISELLAKAEDADSTSLQDGLTIPAEIQRREDRSARPA
jgi:hypothetical protein